MINMMKTKVFGGKRYRMFGVPWSDKSAAFRKAKWIRSKDIKARVVSEKGKWIVYAYTTY